MAGHAEGTDDPPLRRLLDRCVRERLITDYQIEKERVVIGMQQWLRFRLRPEQVRPVLEELARKAGIQLPPEED
jgi:hypothetical protein